MSRFTKDKATTDEDEGDSDDESDPELAAGANEEGVVGEVDDDEIDPAVEASDQAMIEEIAKELEGDEVDDDEMGGESQNLTYEETVLGQTSLSKV